MNSRTTWSLLALAAALLVLIIFIERPYRKERDRKPDARVFPDLNIASITNLEIHPAGNFEIRAEKTNGIWQLVKPVSYPADSAKIEALLRALASLNSQGHITSEDLSTRPKAQEDFGFHAPQFSVVFQQGDVPQHLLIGAKTVIGDQVYIQVLGGNGIHLADIQLLKFISAKANDWRDPNAVPFRLLAEASAIEVRSGSKNLRLELNLTNRLWRLTKPLAARANSSKIYELLTKLSSARAVEFVSDDSNIDFEKYGLPNLPTQNPELELAFLDGTNLLGGVQIGTGPTNNSAQVFARRLNQNAVFTVPGEPFEPWRAPYADFRERRLIDLSTNAVTTLEIRGQDNFVLLRQTNDNWRMTQPEDIPIDMDLVRELLLILSRIEVGFENDVVTDFGAFGLNAPVLQCTLRGSMTNAFTRRMDTAVEQLYFGTNQSKKVFIRRNNEERVYSIDPQEFDLFPRASWQLRERRIWDFAASNVTSVTIQQHGKIRKIVHDAEGEWSLAPGSQGIINPFLLEEAVHRLGGLKAVFWVARGEENREKFGFKEANHQILIEVKKNGRPETLTLELGGYSPFFHPYAAVYLNGERMVFEFPWDLFFNFIRSDLSIIPPPLPVK